MAAAAPSFSSIPLQMKDLIPKFNYAVVDAEPLFGSNKAIQVSAPGGNFDLVTISPLVEAALKDLVLSKSEQGAKSRVLTLRMLKDKPIDEALKILKILKEGTVYLHVPKDDAKGA